MSINPETPQHPLLLYFVRELEGGSWVHWTLLSSAKDDIWSLLMALSCGMEYVVVRAC